MVYKFSNERTKGSGIKNKGNLHLNSQLAEELRKSIIKNFRRINVYSSFKELDIFYVLFTYLGDMLGLFL